MVPKFCIICSMLVRCRSFIKLHVRFAFLVWFVIVIGHIHSDSVRLALLISFVVYMLLFVVLLRFFCFFALSRSRALSIWSVCFHSTTRFVCRNVHDFMVSMHFQGLEINSIRFISVHSSSVWFGWVRLSFLPTRLENILNALSNELNAAWRIFDYAVLIIDTHDLRMQKYRANHVNNVHCNANKCIRVHLRARSYTK